MRTDIFDALVGRLLPNMMIAESNITNPKTPVAMPFQAYTPTAGKAYLDIHALMYAEPDHPSLRASASTFNRGIFQVDAVTPDGSGDYDGVTLQELIAARYPNGTELIVGEGLARFKLQLVKEPAIASAVKDGSWVRFPVSISFLVITKGL